MTELHSFLKRLSIENVAKALPNRRIKGYPGGGASPYKAILLLVVFQKIKNGDPKLREGIVHYENCVDGFELLYREIFGLPKVEQLHEKIVQPFWNLGTGKPRFWKLIPAVGAAAELRERVQTRGQVKSKGLLKKLVDHAVISLDDVELLCDDIANDAVRGFFVTAHFQEQGGEVFRALKKL